MSVRATICDTTAALRWERNSVGSSCWNPPELLSQNVGRPASLPARLLDMRFVLTYRQKIRPLNVFRMSGPSEENGIYYQAMFAGKNSANRSS